MKNKNIIYNNFISKQYSGNKINKNFVRDCPAILKKIKENLDTVKDNFHSLSSKFNLKFKRKNFDKFKNFKTVAIIGMGGSILGSEAIYYFLKNKIKKKFIFFNNIDNLKLSNLKNQKNLNKILFIIISKSGTTIETLSNFLALGVLKKNSKNIIVISEKSDNPLYILAKKNNLYHVEHKKYIGGRYSILTEVGIVPAYLMGLNIVKLRKNLLDHFKPKNQNFLKDSAIKLASILKTNKLKNIVLFNYSSRLNKFLYWNQQLIAESLGKKRKGFLPTISKAPKDHHSLLQLYLDGPKDKLFYIFSDETNEKAKTIIKNKDAKLSLLNNKNLNQIKIAQKNAFKKTLQRNNIPHREFIIKKFNEETLGELFSYFILEIAIIGKLSGINPFNQPAVDQVKIDTKKFLS